MWVAYLNLENLYGSEEGTLQLLSRALAHTDARRMYLAAVDIFDRTDKVALVEQCFKAMTRKFSEAPEVRAAAKADGKTSWELCEMQCMVDEVASRAPPPG